MKSFPKQIVLSLGGSMISQKNSDGTRDDAVLDAWAKELLKLSSNSIVVVIVGGGYNARVRIEEALKANNSISAEDLDWIGINATWENAQNLLLKCNSLNNTKSYIDQNIIKNPDEFAIQKNTVKGLFIGGGWKPGRSTDYDAVYIAAKHRIDTVYNITNINSVYESDPKTTKNPQKLGKYISLTDFIKVVGTTWKPGLNVPFDPIATKLAFEKNINVKIVFGGYMSNVEDALLNGKFEGNTIHP